MRRTALLVAALFLFLAPEAEAACRPYLDFGKRPAFVSGDPNSPARLDSHGVPVIHYSFGTHRNPTFIAQWGLQHYSWWCRRHKRVNRATALHAARVLLASQRSDGAWAYHFAFTEGPVQLNPPWTSALAQGNAISLFVRAYQLTHDRRYLNAAQRALRPLTQSQVADGTRSLWSGHPWYEEYPGSNANHVLNGYEFTLIGLHDFSQSRLARRLFTAGVDSLVWAIPVFDGGPTGSYYAAGHYLPVDKGYLQLHVLLTRTLYRITHREILRLYADRWKAALRRQQASSESSTGSRGLSWPTVGLSAGGLLVLTGAGVFVERRQFRRGRTGGVARPHRSWPGGDSTP